MGIFNNNTEKMDRITKGYFFEQLPKELHPGYESVASGILSFKNRIQVLSAKSNEDVELILNAVLDDDALLFYIRQTKFEIQQTGSSFLLLVNYIYNKRKALQLTNEIEEKARSIINQYIATDMSDYEKCLAIHDYMTEHISYNFSALAVDSVHDAYTIEGTLLKHQAVCEGIAKAISFLLGELGIMCIIVRGRSNIDNEEDGHAWNIVKLNQRYYHLDATWDLQEVNRFSSRSHMYVNLDDESILINHTWDLQKYPSCNSNLENYYVKEKSFFRTMRSFELYVQKFFKSNLIYMDVRFEDTLELPDDKGEMLATILQKEMIRQGKSFHIMYSFSYSNYVFQAELQPQ